MAKQCAICNKKSIMTWKLKKLRGKYNRTIKKRKYPNLQKVLIPADIKRHDFKKYAGKRILMCTQCKKTMNKRK